MARNFKKIFEGLGIFPKTTSTVSAAGELDFDTTSDKLNLHNGTSSSPVVTEDHAATLTQKEISGDDNNITDVVAANVDNVPSGNLAATTVQAALDELQTDIDTRATSTALTAHIDDTSDAHDASAISSVAAGNLAATNVQTALDELQTDIDTRATSAALTAHIDDTSAAHAASAIANTPSGNLAATDVQAALDELQTDVDSRATSSQITDHINDSSDAHTGSAITNTPSGNLAATTVQGALNELQTDIDTRATTTALSNHEADTTSIHGITDTSALVTLTGTQALTNKDIDGGTASNTNRITLPKDTKANLDALTRKEGTIVYASDLDKGYIDDGSTLVEIGSGAGSGGINYIENGTAEDGTTGWTTYDDTTAIPVDLTAGSADFNFTQDNSDVLRDDESFWLQPHASGLGNGAAYAFTLDRADLAKMMTISFDYEINTPASFTEGDITLWVYAANGTTGLIQPTSYILPKTIGPARFSTQFQTTADSTSYRFAIHQATANTGYSVRFDNIRLGPSEIVTESAIVAARYSTAAAQTLEAAGSGEIVDFGTKTYDTHDAVTTGASWKYTAPVPGIYDIDVQITSENATWVAADHFEMFLRKNGTQVQSIGYWKAPVDHTNPVPLSGSGSIELVAGDYIDIFVDHARTGGNFQLLNSALYNHITISKRSGSSGVGAEPRVIAARYGGTVTDLANAVSEEILFSTKAYDTHNAYNTATGEYTIPVPGWYKFFAQIGFASHTPGGETSSYQVNLDVDGAGEYNVGSAQALFIGAATSKLIQSTGDLYLTAGQKVRVIGYHNTGATRTLINNAQFTYLTVEKISGPSSIAASESVTARFSTDAGQSIDAASQEIVNFEDVDFDSHGAVTVGASWKFTAPISGKYSVKAMVRYASANWVDGSIASLAIFKNGTVWGYLDTANAHAALTAKYLPPLVGSDEIRLLAGEYIDLRVDHGEAAARSLQGYGPTNHVVITRVGNY